MKKSKLRNIIREEIIKETSNQKKLIPDIIKDLKAQNKDLDFKKIEDFLNKLSSGDMFTKSGLNDKESKIVVDKLLKYKFFEK